MPAQFPYTVSRLRGSHFGLIAEAALPRDWLEAELRRLGYNAQSVGAFTLFRPPSAGPLTRSSARLTDCDAWFRCAELKEATVVGDRLLVLLGHPSSHAHAAKLKPLLERVVTSEGCRLKRPGQPEQSAEIEALLASRVVTDSPEPRKSAPEQLCLRCLDGPMDVERVGRFLLDIDGVSEAWPNHFVFWECAEQVLVAERHGFSTAPSVLLSPNQVVFDLECTPAEALGTVRVFLDWLLDRHALADDEQGPLGIVTDHVLPRVAPPSNWYRPRFETLADDASRAAYELLEAETLQDVERGLQHFRQPGRERVAAALSRDTEYHEGELWSGPLLEGLSWQPYVTLALYSLANPEACAQHDELCIDCWARLSALPPELARWTGLRKLVLMGFVGTALPEVVLELSNLSELEVHAYELEKLPHGIARLTALRRLDIPAPQISYQALLDAAPALRALTRLEEIRVRWQPSPAQREALASALPGVRVG